MTGLHCAVVGGFLEIVGLLFEYAADLDFCNRDKDGKTIVEDTLYLKNLKIMKMMAFHKNTF